MQQVHERKETLMKKINRKIKSIEDLLYSKRNEEAVREELQQLNDLNKIIQDIIDGTLCVEDKEKEEFEEFDEKMCSFKHKIHNWLRSITEENEERSSIRSSKKNRNSAKTRSTASGTSSNSSRRHKLEEKMKLAELQAEAEFLKINAEMRLKAEELEMQEKIAKSKARVSIIEEDEEDELYRNQAEGILLEKRSQSHEENITQRSMEWQQEVELEEIGKNLHDQQIMINWQQHSAEESRAISNIPWSNQGFSGDIMEDINKSSPEINSMELPNLWRSPHNVSAHSNLFSNRFQDKKEICNPRGEINTNNAEKGTRSSQRFSTPNATNIEERRKKGCLDDIHLRRDQQEQPMMFADKKKIEDNQRKKVTWKGDVEDAEDRTSDHTREQAGARSQTTTDVSKELCSLLKQQSAPDIEMDTFTGNPIEYECFMSMFSEVVEKRVDDQVGKLMRLLKFTQGEPKDLIKHCINESREHCFNIAKNLLDRQYGNRHRILAAYRSEINNLEFIKANDSKALRRLYTFLLRVQGLKINETHKPLDNADTICKILAKLPLYLQDRWSRGVHTMRKNHYKEPALQDLIQFIEDEMVITDDPLFSRGAINKITDSRPDKTEMKSRKLGRAKNFFTAKVDEDTSKKTQWTTTCPLCKENHNLERCKEYLKLTIDERGKNVFKLKLCFKCLKPMTMNHTAANCKYPKICVVCNRKHPTSLHGLDTIIKHEEKNEVTEIPTSREQSDSASRSNTIVNALTKNPIEVVSLCIVPVEVKNNKTGCLIRTYAMLDSCSQGSFISNNLKKKLSLSGPTTSLLVKTMNGDTESLTTTINNLQVRGTEQDSRWITVTKLYCREEIPVDKEDMASHEHVKQWSYLADILNQMVIPEGEHFKVDLLVGANCPVAIEPHKFIKSQNGGPYAQKTVLGWCVIGPVTGKNKGPDSRKISTYQTGAQKMSKHHFVAKEEVKELDIPNMIQRMYNQDFIENSKVYSEEGLSLEDKQFLKIVEAGTKLVNGKYEVPLPLKNKELVLPDNREQALRRFKTLLKRFSKDSVWKDWYFKSMEVIFDKGYAELADNKKKGWFIPHHGVIHPAKPNKVRVVFDASAEHTGQSLNQYLLKGPDMTSQLVGVLLRFRENLVAVTGDIEGMFYQVKIPPDQRHFFKFLWFCDNNPNLDVCEYQMTSHIFGGTSSPSCSNYALRRTAVDNADKYNHEVLESLSHNFYVDDLLKSLKSTEAAIEYVKAVKELCSKGGFNLTKFMSNKKEVLEAVPKEDRKFGKEEDHIIGKLPEESTLGMIWNAHDDKLRFKMNKKEKALTRRGILSTVSSIYDPLGLIGPFILKGRQILQKICKANSNWDDPIENDIKEEWLKWRETLDQLEHINVQRSAIPEDFGEIKERSIHVFSDASDTGYGIACYLKQVDVDERIFCCLLYGRSRVAPLKYISIPRMELTAALLAAKSGQMLKRELDGEIKRVQYWTDSQAVLGYLSNEARNFKIFVANRVQQIQDLTDINAWNYIRSKENPADFASRGLHPSQITKAEDWFYGPKFLYQTEYESANKSSFSVPENDEELKVKVKVNEVIVKRSLLDQITDTTNDWSKMVRILLLVKRFIRKITPKKTKLVSPENDIEEKIEAEHSIIKLAQKQSFPAELKQLTDDGAVRRSSSIFKLNPILRDGIICVGGRLTKSSLPESEKHPIILPKNHKVSKSIIYHFHKAVAHGGRNSTLNRIRQNGYWIINGSSLTRKIILDCVICCKLFRKCEEQKMADLPKDRTEIVPPFTYVGVDVSGPFVIKERRSSLKRYGVMFTCLNSRAVHIEVINSMSTDSFIMALRRMIGRRGDIKLMRSDNGTNFIGTDNEMRKALLEMDESKIKMFTWKHNIQWIQWKRNPPAASHMGGVWERQIRSARRILVSLMENHKERLNEEALVTLMIETEAILNSRPLTVESINDENTLPLAPTNLLTLKTDVILPPPGSFDTADTYSRKQWRRIQVIANEFWQRWRKEFLQTLQTRQKWNATKRSMKIGDVVMLNDGSERSCWPMGRICEVFKDNESVVRSVNVQVYDKATKKLTTLKRPVSKLVTLVAKEFDSPSEEP